jgi:hypothetical protein
MGKIRRLLSLAGSLVFMLSLVYPPATAWAQGQPITFSAYGDIPYGSSDYAILQQHIADHNRYSPSAFLLHIGDMLSGSCIESKYADFANFMKGLAVPAYLIVGDNEYSDCDDPAAALALWKKYFLTFGESFCGAPYTEHQNLRPENIAFTMNGVLFAGINLVGGSVHDQNEWDIRMQQDADWVSQQFQAKVSQVRAAVVFAQTGNRSAVTPFTTLFRAAAAAFAKPVLYIHGDLHTYKYDQPWPEKNITRLEVPKGNAEPPLEVTINMNTAPAEGMGMYTIKRNPWSGKQPYNMPPCANAGSDQTIASLAASLQGQATDDGDPTGSLTTTWSMVSGAGTVAFGDAHAPATTATFSTGGTYVLQLTADDGQLQKSDELTIAAQAGGPTLSINDVNINESDVPQGGMDAIFTVSLANPDGQTVTVDYQTADGTATNGNDYFAASGTLSFPNGTTTQTITVTIPSDQIDEPDETFFVNLRNASNAGLADAQGVGTIIDDDLPPAPIPPTVSSFNPAGGPVGTQVTIIGSQFTNATHVSFNGIPPSGTASFTINSDTQILATVPNGATTGKITVTNPGGIGESVDNFIVTAPVTQYNLIVNTSGSGGVALNPSGGIYDSGATVILTATPAAGFQFSGWSGDLTGSTNPETITMNANKNVAATFVTNSTNSNTNLAQDKPVTASSTYSGKPATNAIDGSTGTYWRSVSVSSSNPIAWLCVDLGVAMTVGRTIVRWKDSYYAKSYEVQVSNDGVDWTKAYSTASGKSGVQDFAFPQTAARYVRLYLTKNNKSSYRILEFEVYSRASAIAKSNGDDLAAAPIPEEFVLEQNYPNPFPAHGIFDNPSTKISFGLPSRFAGSRVTIKVYTINGMEVKTLIDAQYPAGMHSVIFQPGNLPSGTYFYVMQAGDVRRVRQLLLVK